MRPEELDVYPSTWVQCSRCFGRGYQPEARRPSRRNPNAVGFYARTCRGCDGRGVRPPVRGDK